MFGIVVALGSGSPAALAVPRYGKLALNVESLATQSPVSAGVPSTVVSTE